MIWGILQPPHPCPKSNEKQTANHAETSPEQGERASPQLTSVPSYKLGQREIQHDYGTLSIPALQQRKTGRMGERERKMEEEREERNEEENLGKRRRIHEREGEGQMKEAEME